MISIHAPRAGRDFEVIRKATPDLKFQSTRPVRGATLLTDDMKLLVFQFQSTRPVRGATHFGRRFHRSYQDFNPRAPCGARRSARRQQAEGQQFQSTRPVRGATQPALCADC